MLNISKQNWYVRLFHFAEMIVDRFGNRWYGENSNNTDVCTFIRTIFVLMPLALLGNIGVYGGSLVVGLYLPLKFFTWAQIGGTVGVFAVICTAVLGIIYLICSIEDIQEWLRKRAYEKRLAEMNKPEKQPTFIDIVWGYLTDFHGKFCVVMKFQSTQESSK